MYTQKRLLNNVKSSSVTEQKGTKYMITKATPEQMQFLRETWLMETAMRIMEVFCDMQVACYVNPYKVDNIGSIERLKLFAEWAREFEVKYSNDPRYDDDYIELTDEFATAKIEEVFK